MISDGNQTARHAINYCVDYPGSVCCGYRLTRRVRFQNNVTKSLTIGRKSQNIDDLITDFDVLNHPEMNNLGVPFNPAPEMLGHGSPSSKPPARSNRRSGKLRRKISKARNSSTIPLSRVRRPTKPKTGAVGEMPHWRRKDAAPFKRLRERAKIGHQPRYSYQNPIP